jgi:hypothetical protein
MKKLYLKIYIFLLLSIPLFSQTTNFIMARLKYSGGGDWYNDQSADINLLKYLSEHTNIKTKPEFKFVDISTDDIFNYPFLFMTGHGNVVFTEAEAQRLRKYLENGGFLYIDDDYGIDKAIRRELKKVFPDKELQELPNKYGLFNCFYKFPNGTPKIHKHDEKSPQSFGIFIGKRLAVLYTYESNPSDGWADPEVHNDPPEIREIALQFGVNIVIWSIIQNI